MDQNTPIRWDELVTFPLDPHEEIFVLLRYARAQTKGKLRQAFIWQAEDLSLRHRIKSVWLFNLNVASDVDGEFSSWMIEQGASCGLCGVGYENGNGILMLLPSITFHAYCIAAVVPESDGAHQPIPLKPGHAPIIRIRRWEEELANELIWGYATIFGAPYTPGNSRVSAVLTGIAGVCHTHCLCGDYAMAGPALKITMWGPRRFEVKTWHAGCLRRALAKVSLSRPVLPDDEVDAARRRLLDARTAIDVGTPWEPEMSIVL